MSELLEVIALCPHLDGKGDGAVWLAGGMRQDKNIKHIVHRVGAGNGHGDCFSETSWQSVATPAFMRLCLLRWVL